MAAPVTDARAREIVKLRKACGCTSGMVLMLASAAGYLVWLRWAHPAPTGTARILLGVGVALAGAVVGKVAGLLWAAARLRRLLARPGDEPVA